MKRTPYKDQVYLDDRTWKEAGTAAGKVMAFGIVLIICVLGAGLYTDGGSDGPTDHERRQLADLAGQVSGESYGVSYEGAKDSFKLPLAVELKPVRPKGREASRTLTQAKAPSITDRFMHKVIMAESSGDANAKLKPGEGTASGLFGFTDGTWKRMVDRHGKAHGISFKDKNQPRAQRVMARLLLEENASILAKLLDRSPSHGEVYMAHMLGPRPAVALIESKGTGKLAMELFPKNVVERNPTIFWNGDEPRTVEEVYRLLDRKVA